MSEVILELGSTPRPAIAQRLAAAPISSLADLWLRLNDEANRLGEIWAATRPSRGLGAGNDDVNAEQLAEIVAEHRRVSVGEAYDDIARDSETYDEVVQLSNGLHDIYRALGARVRSGYADERDWDGYLDLADDLQPWRFNLTSRPGADDRVKMGDPWAFDLTSRPGGDDRLRMAGAWNFDLTTRPGGDDRLQMGQPPWAGGQRPPWCPYRQWLEQQQQQLQGVTLAGGFLKKIGKAAKGAIKKVGKVLKKAAPLLIAAAATVVTGGAAAPLLAPAMAMSFGGKQKSKDQVVMQETAADVVAQTAMMQQAGVEVPPEYANAAATAAEALKMSPGGEQALNSSVQFLKSTAGQQGVPVPGSAEDALKTVEEGTVGAEDQTKKYLLYGGIAAGGLLAVGIGLLAVAKLTS